LLKLWYIYTMTITKEKKMHLVVDEKIGDVVSKEVERRNKKLKPGERRHTSKSVTEEAIIYWKDNNK